VSAGKTEESVYTLAAEKAGQWIGGRSTHRALFLAHTFVNAAPVPGYALEERDQTKDIRISSAVKPFALYRA
jgi:hypothetical protein